MPTSKIYGLGGINIGVNPLLQEEGQFTRLVNFDSDPYGVKIKRRGYINYLGTPDNDDVATLFNFTRNSGTQLWNYRLSGSVLYYSTQGTGAWTVCGGGTFTEDSGAYLGHAVLENNLIIGNGIDYTRHSTNGTSFGSTTSAPIAAYFEEYQNRIYAGGTASSLFYSTPGTLSDWTTDSSSFKIPGAGKINQVFKTADRLFTTKNSGAIFKYDGYSLTDLATDAGPSSSESLAVEEDFRFWINQQGIYGFGGAHPQLLSNQIRPYIYNDEGEDFGISSGEFSTAPGVVYRHKYHVFVDTISSGADSDSINNALLVYNFQLNEWTTYSMPQEPRSFLVYKDVNGAERFIFGDDTGQCYTLGGTALSDMVSGTATTISAQAEYLFSGQSFKEKEFKWLRCLFNPGMQGQVYYSLGNSLSNARKNWTGLGAAVDGMLEFHFPAGARGRFLYIKVSDSSTTTRLKWHGIEVDWNEVQR